MKSKDFKFDYINNGTDIIQSESMSFLCPICKGFHLAIGLTDYVPHHEFYEDLEFFCGHCLSQYLTISDGKIKLTSEAIVI